MIAFTCLALLSAAPVSLPTPSPPGALISVQPVTQRPRVEPKLVKSVVTQLEQALTATGVAVLASDEGDRRLQDKRLTPAKCAGARTCVVGVAAGLQAVVVAVDVGRLGKQTVVRWFAISPEGEDLTEAVEISAENDGLRAALEGALKPFVASLKSKLAAPVAEPGKEVARTDRPVAEEKEKKKDLTPRGTEPKPELVAKASGPKLGKWFVAGGAVVAAGVAAGLGAGALATKGSIDASAYELEGMRATTLTQSQLDASAAQANGLATASLISALVAAGLTATATVLFVKGDGP